MDDKKKDLCLYRLENAKETLGVAKLCYDYGHYKDTVNRCYYAAFYAVKAVLALAKIDFKRHKDVVAYFNKNYVAKNIFSRDLGKQLGRLKRKREDNDYDDFVLTTKEEAFEQYEAAQYIVSSIEEYLKQIFIKDGLELPYESE